MTKLVVGLLALSVGCAHQAAVTSNVEKLVASTHHMPTLAERKAAACKRPHLVAPEPATVTSSAAIPSGELVRSVAVRDRSGGVVEVPSEALKPMVVGQPLTAEITREASRRLWQTGKFDDVLVEDDGGVVTFRVTPRRLVGEVFADGMEPTDVFVASGALYDPAALVLATRVRAAVYATQGYLDADLSLSSEFADEDHRAIDVCIRFDRGAKVTLDAMRVRGSAFDAALEAVLAQQDTVNVHGAVADEDVLARDELILAAALYDHGLLAHKITRKTERKGAALTVVFEVEDGKVYRYARIDVRGDLQVPKAQYMKLVTSKPGDVFSRTVMIKLVEDIKTLHSAHGLGDDVTVEPDTELDSQKSTVTVNFVIKAPQQKPSWLQ